MPQRLDLADWEADRAQVRRREADLSLWFSRRARACAASPRSKPLSGASLGPWAAAAAPIRPLSPGCDRDGGLSVLGPGRRAGIAGARGPSVRVGRPDEPGRGRISSWSGRFSVSRNLSPVLGVGASPAANPRPSDRPSTRAPGKIPGFACTIGAFVQVTSGAGPARVRPREGIAPFRKRASRRTPMSWTAPIVVEICAGLEVTAYLTAEM